MKKNEQSKSLALLLFGFNVLVIALCVFERWESGGGLWAMGLIGGNLFGLFFGGVIGGYLSEMHEQEKARKRDDMWIDRNEKLRREIEVLEQRLAEQK